MSTNIVNLILFLVGSRVPRRLTTHTHPSLTKFYHRPSKKVIDSLFFMQGQLQRVAHKNNTVNGISVLSAKLETYYTVVPFTTRLSTSKNRIKTLEFIESVFSRCLS